VGLVLGTGSAEAVSKPVYPTVHPSQSGRGWDASEAVCVCVCVYVCVKNERGSDIIIYFDSGPKPKYMIISDPLSFLTHTYTHTHTHTASLASQPRPLWEGWTVGYTGFETASALPVPKTRPTAPASGGGRTLRSRGRRRCSWSGTLVGL
jgi:hypothetical protein